MHTRPGRNINAVNTMAKNVISGTNHFSIGELIDNGRVSLQHMLVVGLCLVFNMLDGFDITALAVTADAIGSEMQLEEDKLGLVFSFSLVGMTMGAMFLASLSDVFGRRTVILASLLAMGGSVLLTGYIESLYSLAVLRFISGLGGGALLACQATLASEYSPEKFRALSVTVVTAGYPLGAMMTGLVAGVIMPEYGWRGMFIGGGSITLFMAFLAFFLLPESLQFLCSKQPANALSKVNDILRKYAVEPVDRLPGADQVAPSTATDGERESAITNMLKLLSHEHRRTTFILWSAFLLCFCTIYFLMSWTPKIMINAGFSTQVANFAFSTLNFGGVLGSFFLGALATRWRLSNVVCVFLLTATAGMLILAAEPAEETLLLMLFFLTGLTLQGGFSGLYAAAAKVYPTEIRATGVGWSIGLGRFGAVIGPAAAGFMIAAGITMSENFVIFAIPIALGGLLAFMLKVR